MGKMSYIAYLAENGNKKELMEEVGAIASATGNTVADIADGFIEAVKTIKKNKNKPAYKNLNKIQKEMIKDATNKISSASIGIRDDKEVF